MSPRLKSLTAKGLLIIGAGTILQLVCLSEYESLLATADRLTKIQQRDKAVLVQLNWLSALLPICGLLALETPKQGGTSENLQSCANLVVRSCDELATLLGGSDAAALKRASEDVTAECTRVASLVNSDKSITVDGINSRSSLKVKYADFAEARKNAILHNRQRVPLSPDLLPRTQNQLRELVHILMAVTVVSALMATVFFLRGVCSKLRALEDDMSRFERGEALKPAVAGSDEIARLDRRFRELTAALAEADQQKQEIVSMVSHDLRAPLSSVQAILCVLSTEELEPLPPESKVMIGKAERNLARMVKLINELLDVELLSANKLTLFRENFSFQNLAEDCVDLVSDLAKSRSIDIEISSTAIELYADKERLAQILTNLLGNAVKFSNPGSSVQLSCRAINEAVCEVQVCDHGRGIPQDLKEQVFERFQQVSALDGTAHKGSGLGLYIARALIELHGGKIGVRDTPGGGSTFWFTLARVQ